MDDLLAVGVPPLTGQAHRQAADSGRANGDLVGLVKQARLTWSQAGWGEQPWSDVMVRPPTVRYEQARTLPRGTCNGIAPAQPDFIALNIC
ncbi:MAG: hypothetical protein ABI693_35125 [Bryobacteraceae bacterium]